VTFDFEILSVTFQVLCSSTIATNSLPYNYDLLQLFCDYVTYTCIVQLRFVNWPQ